MLLKENYFISLYGCFEASITLSKGRWDISCVQEKYFLSSMYFETCLNHMHGDHMWKRDGQRSPTLSKVQTTVSQMAWLDKQVTITTPGYGVTAEELLLQELSDLSSSHPANGKWLHWRGTAPLPQDGKVSSGTSQGLSCYAGRWCDLVTVTLALSFSTEERAGNLVTAEVLKIASSPKSWIDPELFVASQQVQQWLCVDHGSATLPKCHVRLSVPKSQKPNRYQKTLFLRGNLGSFYLPSAEETTPLALPRWQLGGEQVPETLLFRGTSRHSTTPQLLFC